jgi:hypothetical protein
MNDREMNVREFAEENYIEPAAKVGGCSCQEDHRLHVALSEQGGRPEIFCPDHRGVRNAYCGTFGRRCGS